MPKKRNSPQTPSSPPVPLEWGGLVIHPAGERFLSPWLKEITANLRTGKLSGQEACSRYCQLKSNWADFLPRARNLNAEQSMSYEFMYCLIFGRIHLT